MLDMPSILRTESLIYYLKLADLLVEQSLLDCTTSYRI
jgi:hypothetical protein